MIYKGGRLNLWDLSPTTPGPTQESLNTQASVMIPS